MKLRTLISAALAFSICSVFTQIAHANGSSNPQTGSEGGSVMSYAQAPRAMTFDYLRNANSVEGYLLVCPFAFKGDGDGCTDRKTGANAWQTFESVAPPGFKVLSYEIRYVGQGYRNLIIYFTPDVPVPKPVITLKNETTVVSPTFTGPITITADMVVVQRKK